MGDSSDSEEFYDAEDVTPVKGSKRSSIICKNISVTETDSSEKDAGSSVKPAEVPTTSVATPTAEVTYAEEDRTTVKNVVQGRRRFQELRRCMQTEEDDEGAPDASGSLDHHTSTLEHPFKIIAHDTMSLQSMTSLGRIGRILSGASDSHYIDYCFRVKTTNMEINPQHTVPTIVDGEFALWESRAIGRYFANKYGQGSDLYPEDPVARALVDQRLDFDLGTLYPRFASYFYPQLFAGAPADEALFKKLGEGLGFLNTFLEASDGKYAAGSKLTLADLSLVATVSTIDAVGISLEPYPNVAKWFELVKATAPGYQKANGEGIDLFKAMIAQLRAKTEL